QDGEIGDGDLEQAISLVREHGTIEDTVERARHYGSIAHDALAIFPDTNYKAALLDTVAFCIDRAH
ncbi:MAG: polyprenyl synthetase family protein, partial [Alphaproteobacteria bacterium]